MSKIQPNRIGKLPNLHMVLDFRICRPYNSDIANNLSSDKEKELVDLKITKIEVFRLPTANSK